MQELMLSVVGGVVSAVIVGSGFHFAAGRELKREAGELRRLNQLILEGLQQAGMVEFARRPDGTISGIKVLISGTSHGTSHDTGILTTATRRKETGDQAQPEPGNPT